MYDKLKYLENLANDNCTCTKDQQTGKDPTICNSCQANHSLNNISVFIEDEFKSLQKKINS